MGRSHRQKPIRLASKLNAIRTGLNLTQEQIVERLNCPEIPLYPASISLYEQSKREPPLLVLLAYARVAGVTMEMLVNDDLELPKPLPSLSGYAWVMKRERIAKHR
jgi:transcriptional regulator with XRE-family HTH domain